MALDKTIYAGPLVHSKSLTELDICLDGKIGVAEDGKIAFVNREANASIPSGWENAKTIHLRENSFFFPGFIGKLLSALKPRRETIFPAGSWEKPPLTTPKRHPHPRLPISQRRRLRQIHPPGLAKHLHLPTGKLAQLPQQSQPHLQPRRRPHPLPRHDNSLLLRHRARACHEPASGHLPSEGATRFRGPRLHGPHEPGLLPG